MAKKSFWKRGEDYAEKVSGELIEQIKRGLRRGRSRGSRERRAALKTSRPARSTAAGTAST